MIRIQPGNRGQRPRPPGLGVPGTSRNHAFSIIELMIALGVVAILVTVSQSLYSGYQDRARVGQAAADLRGISTKVEQFRIEFRRLPTVIDRVMRPAPLDPWGREYRYLPIEGGQPSIMGQVRKDKSLVPLNSDFDLYSVGPDGESRAPLTAEQSHDDIIRASDGGFFGSAASF